MSGRRRLPMTKGGHAEALAMIEDARRIGHISFDPNCRPKLVKHKASYVERMNAFAPSADILRMSDADFEFLYGRQRIFGKAQSFMAAGAKLGRRHMRNSRVPKHGIKQRARWRWRRPPVEVVDTIGAGDSFQAALLFALRAIWTDREGIRWRAPILRTSSRPVIRFALARPSHVGAPGPILRALPTSARNWPVFFRQRRVSFVLDRHAAATAAAPRRSRWALVVRRQAAKIGHGQRDSPLPAGQQETSGGSDI